AFVTPISAVIIGLIAGVLVCLATFALEKMQIDDPVGAVPVHFVNGVWGVLAVGIFAAANPDTAAWNGIDTAVTGLLYGGTTQIAAQFLEVLSITAFAFGLSYAFFTVLKQMGLLRSDPEAEMAGLDLPEMGIPGYVTDLPGLAGLTPQAGLVQPAATVLSPTASK
ncbi:MAG TPA: hypothetical protein P5526_32250, partial [Anaerolineae bacterium]|nr:hypothetical protein [Anaerolineae bacterium]